MRKFLRIDGAEWAGAFAFHAFFSLLPLTILLVTLTTTVMGRDRAGQAVIAYMEKYIPIGGELQSQVFDTITGVIAAREQAGAVALLVLLWVALQCFSTLISATNRAWGAMAYSWWRRPLKSLILLGVTAGTILSSMAAPMLAKLAGDWLLPMVDYHIWVFALGSFAIPLLVVFLGLSLFYKLAPHRPTRFAEVWAGALYATVLLLAAESLFVFYLKHFATLNAVYGAFGGIMALLLWIYLSGCIFIFGACLCAARYEDLAGGEGTR